MPELSIETPYSHRHVLHVDSAMSFRGGQRQLLLLAKAQHERSDSPDPTLLVRNPRLIDAALEAGLHVEAWYGPIRLRGLWQLRRSIARLGSPLIHVHDSRSHGAVRIIAPRRSQDQLVVHRRIDDAPRQRFATRWKYAKGAVICVSDAIVKVMLDFGVEKERLHLVRSALPTAKSRSVTPVHPHAGGRLRLLSVGALVKHKGHRTLIEALASKELPVSLRIVGGGPLEVELLDLIARHGLTGQVVLAGDLADVSSEIENADLLVHPSLSEGLGTAVLDAMWGALPVLASAAGGLPELVKDGVTGWLVQPGSSSDLSDKLDSLAGAAARDPEFLCRHGKAGRRRAENCFPFGAMVRKTSDVYDTCL